MKSSKGSIAVEIPPEYVPLVAIALATLANGLFNSICVSLGYGYPYSTFLFDPADRFADFFKVALALDGPELRSAEYWPSFIQGYLSHNPYGGLDAVERGQLSVFHLPPLSFLLYVSSRHVVAYVSPVVLLACLLAAIALILFAIVRRYLRDDELFGVAAVSLVLSYPFLMIVTRGNVPAAIVGTALVAAIVSSADNPKPLAMVLLVALAINCRPNAAVFLGVFFLHYNFRRAAILSLMTLILSSGIALASLLVATALYPDYRLSTFLHALDVYYAQYLIGSGGLAFGSSLYGALKMLIQLPGNWIFGNREWWFAPAPIPDSVRWLSFAMPIIFLLVAYYLLVKSRLTPIVFVFMLCACYALASIVFADYHLLVFFAVVLMGVKRLRSSEMLNRAETIAVWASVLLLSPKNFVYVAGVSLQVILNPLILTVAAMMTLRWGAVRNESV